MTAGASVSLTCPYQLYSSILNTLGAFANIEKKRHLYDLEKMSDCCPAVALYPV